MGVTLKLDRATLKAFLINAANGVQDKECSENIYEDELCSETKSSCQINSAGDPKALISTGCSGNQAPEHAIACGNLKCAYYGIQDVRCFCSTEKCNLDTNYPIECDPQPPNGAKKQVGTTFSVFLVAILVLKMV